MAWSLYKYESAQHIEELQRILALVAPAESSARPTTHTGPAAHSARLRQENIAAIENAIQQARALIDEINTQLETLMLQAVRMGKRASDVVRTAQLADEATETLKRLQMVVNARREAADELIASFRHTIPDPT